jgi:hypothetical protein
MNGYIPPAAIRTYSIADLCADAATCVTYTLESDRNLKREIERVEQPLERLRAIRKV